MQSGATAMRGASASSSSSSSSRLPHYDADLESFINAISNLPAEEWQKRIFALKKLVNSIPDYSTTTTNDYNDNNDDDNDAVNVSGHQRSIPWYRSSVSVRRLSFPLRSLLLDARSAVVKDATELIKLLMIVKLQPRPASSKSTSALLDKEVTTEQNTCDGGLETINNGGGRLMQQYIQQQQSPPAFVGRLLFKDILPAILDLSKQTVKVIRAYGVNMTIAILPHCRVKSIVPILLERMKTHINRTVREDCARYLRCVLETWPTDGHTISIGDTSSGNTRVDESLSLDSAKQIGFGLGNTLSDSANPVRDEARRGFQVLFTRLRPVWDDVMRAGAVRDMRLRKKLMDAAAVVTTTSGSDGNLFDDLASVGDMSLNSAVSGLSHASYRSNMSHRSHVSRGMMGSNGVPSVIGTPKVSPRARSRIGGGLQTNSPRYMQGTGSSAGKVHVKEASDKYSANQYVTSTGHVLSTPSPRNGKLSKPVGLYGVNEAFPTPQQPFASLLQTPSRQMTPESSHTPCKILRKRLSRRISGIKPGVYGHAQSSPIYLSSIDETEDCNEQVTPSVINDIHSSEITNVALEVIAAHLSHLEQIESLITKEKELLLGLNKQLGISITNGMMTLDLACSLSSLSEEQVCDYFESVHMVVDKQRNSSEELLREMERISQGDVSSENDVECQESMNGQNLPQSTLLDSEREQGIQRNLKDEFVASIPKE
ncbi:hypothetical protein ACHAWU_005477 [Discostella pseudostelligera]|uniref:TOG domain-containing protein n=1 Tax=Discostella pseudostelligera TaxID=259834 RepID=A0ABD3MVN7_9STRA